MTEAYVFDRGEGPLPAEAAERLPSWRRARLSRLTRQAARQEALAAGLLYAYAMGRRGVSPSSPVTLLPAGKPVLAGRDDVFFSLSHSGRYVLCAVSGRPVGADVQEPRAVNPGMLRWFHPDERAWLESLDPNAREAAFFRLWTRKEAWVKAVSGDRGLSLSETDVIRPLSGWTFRDYALPGGCAAALCAAEGEPLPGLSLVTRAALLAAEK